MTAPSRYPLAWPAHRPRTKNRRPGNFQSGGKKVTFEAACARLEVEIERLGGVYPLLSTNYELRMDGKPRLDRGHPADPGVCVYFQIKGQPYAMACDSFTEATQNVAAIANHIEATRRIERYGVATAAESLQAFAALPGPGEQPPWWTLLGIPRAGATTQVVEAAFRAASMRYHPDRPGGSHDAMARLNRARDEALKELTP